MGLLSTASFWYTTTTRQPVQLRLNAPMLQSSKDLFYIVLAFSALWLTIFLCWMIYSMAVILRNANDVIHEMRERLRGISESLDFMRDKVDLLAGS
ncbi:MAG: hypothetical protein HY437_01145, partial [Candidatus Magasanikbacteria bacterium]|nr:hypothetical protein [Candidatus Magasanikbacteria bacterium]